MALKKKTSRRTKRIVRKTIAGLCMASAIIVACIPAPKTAAYVTPTGYATIVYDSEGHAYSELTKKWGFMSEDERPIEPQTEG